MTTEITTIPSSPEGGAVQDPAAVAATLARAEGKPVEQPPTEFQLLPKFKTVEDLQKSYIELEKLLHSKGKLPDGQTQEGQQSTEAKPTGEAKQDDLKIDDAKKAVENAGLNFDTYQQAFLSNGKLEDAHYEELQKAGIPKNLVDAHIAGIQALQERETASIMQQVGGRESYQAMTAWAKANLSEAEINEFNSLVTNPSASIRNLAVSGLHARFTKAGGGAEAGLLSGRATNTTAGAGFSSMADMKAAMADKRYGKDAHYTRDVEKRAAASRF